VEETDMADSRLDKGTGVALDLRGWSVLAADAVHIGTVCDLEGDGLLVVELDPQKLMGHLPVREPEREETRLNDDDRLPGGSRLGGDNQLHDVDPTVGEAQTTGFQNPGAQQHAGELPGAAPWNRGDMADDEEEPRAPRVLIRVDRARLKEAEKEVVLEDVRSVDVASLPRAR
jgi:hypothetical protein